MKSSRTLDKQGVNEIDLKSPSSIGDCIFGMGIVLDSFQTAGTIPDRSDVLKGKIRLMASFSWVVNEDARSLTDGL